MHEHCRLAPMQNGALIAAIVSAAALVVSLLFLARQTKESARQSALANQLTGVQATSEIYATVDRILYHLLEFPELRGFFYEGVAAPGEGDDQQARARVLTIAELFANAIERGLDTYRSLEPAADFRTPMDAYAGDIVDGSPALRSLVVAHPGWWPNLETWMVERGAERR
jgi:hypothetical protein